MKVKSKEELFDEIKYIYTKCPICGNDHYSQVIRFGFNERFNYVRCKVCSIIYLNPKFVYDQSYIDLAYGDTFHIYESLKKRWGNNVSSFIDDTLKNRDVQLRYKLIGKYLKQPGKILDIGCAVGIYVLYGKTNGWDAYGTEICKPMAKFCTDKLKLKVYNKQLSDVKFKSNMFDVITLYQVIEHFENPMEVMKEIYRILKPGGIVLLETPNCDSLDTKLKRLRVETGIKKWHIAKGQIAEHFYEFNLKGFKYACEKLKFKILYAHTFSSRDKTGKLTLRHLLNLGTKFRFIIQK